MQRIVFQNSEGITLVEVMLALLVLLLVCLALMQTALLSVNLNVANALRDEAVSIAEMRMNDARALPFSSSADNLVPDPDPPVKVKRTFRNMPDLIYSTVRTVTNLDTAGDSRRVDINVTWQWNGQSYTHTVSAIFRRQTT